MFGSKEAQQPHLMLRRHATSDLNRCRKRDNDRFSFDAMLPRGDVAYLQYSIACRILGSRRDLASPRRVSVRWRARNAYGLPDDDMTHLPGAGEWRGFTRAPFTKSTCEQNWFPGCGGLPGS